MSKLARTFCGLSILVSLSVAAEATETERHILIYGDSIAWGWVPTDHGFPTTRYPKRSAGRPFSPQSSARITPSPSMQSAAARPMSTMPRAWER